MAYLTVTTAVDVVAPGDGKLSLREAIAQANGSSGPDTIVFAATVVGQTLMLTGGELVVTTISRSTATRTTRQRDDDRRQSRQPRAEHHGCRHRRDAEWSDPHARAIAGRRPRWRGYAWKSVS